MTPADPDRPTRTRRDRLERSLGYDLPKQTVWHHSAAVLVMIATFPIWLSPRTLRRWRLCRRITTWKRAMLLFEDAWNWPWYFTAYLCMALPVAVAVGWVLRRFDHRFHRRGP